MGAMPPLGPQSFMPQQQPRLGPRSVSEEELTTARQVQRNIFFSYTQFSIQFETRKKQFEIRVCIFLFDVHFKSQNKYDSCSKNYVLKYILRYTYTESL